MDDPRPLDAGDARRSRRRPPRAEQGVDERAAGVPRRRVDDEPGRLVDDQQVVVLVDDRDVGSRAAAIEVDAARLRDDRAAGRLPGSTMRVRLERAAAGGQAAVGDELLDVAPGQAGQVGDVAIDPRPRRHPSGTAQERRMPGRVAASAIRPARLATAADQRRPNEGRARCSSTIAKLIAASATLNVKNAGRRCRHPRSPRRSRGAAGRSGCRSRRRAGGPRVSDRYGLRPDRAWYSDDQRRRRPSDTSPNTRRCRWNSPNRAPVFWLKTSRTQSPTTETRLARLEHAR